MDRVELVHLRTFVAVADLGSITRAAERLSSVQSNITARVRQLEEQLAQTLFARSRRGMALTEAGARLYPRARDILDRVQALHAPRAAAGVAGSLRLGVVETVATLDLPPMLADLRHRHPGLSVELSTGTTRELIRRLKDLKLDVAVVSGLENDRTLAFVSARTDDLALVYAASGEAPAIRRNRATAPIYVYQAGCAFRAALEGWLGSLKAVPAAINELGTLDGILAHVAAGNGFTALPARIVERHLLRKALLTRPIPGGFGQVGTSIVWRHDSTDSPRRGAFAAVALKCLGKAD